MATASRITSEEMITYRTAARQRQEREQRELVRRQERAWELARCAANELRAKFGADRVMVFGSLVRAGCFTPWSDVDIAAWGISPKDTFKAIGAIMDLDAEIEINLVDIGTCHPELLASIEREGVEL